MSEKHGKAPLSIKADDTLTVVHAREMKEKFLNALESTDSLELDLSHVNEMDTAGFQLLVVLKREAELQEKSFRISGYSPAAISVLKTYNMEDYFGVQDNMLGITEDEEGEETG